MACTGWPFGPRAAAGQEPPPQPPPPPNFALRNCAASAMQQSFGSTGCDPQAWAPAAGAAEPVTQVLAVPDILYICMKGVQNQTIEPIVSMQTTAGSNGAMASDGELAGLLTAWYNAGYETGRHCERRRLQAQMQKDAVIPQSVR